MVAAVMMGLLLWRVAGSSGMDLDHGENNSLIMLKCKIGSGSSSEVFRCSYVGETRAVKVFKDVRRYGTESETMWRMKNMNISSVPKVRFIGNGMIVMDEIVGKQVDEVVGEMCREELGKTIAGMFNGLAEIHKNGVTHGDPHGRNMMVEEESRKVKFIDFGYSFMGDIVVDFTRLRRKVLENIAEWRSVIDRSELRYPAAFDKIVEMYDTERYQWVFSSAGFNAPLNEHYGLMFFRTIFWRMNGELREICDRYLEIVRGEASRQE